METEHELLPAQLELWTLDRLHGRGRVSLRADLLRLDGPLSRPLFHQALRRALTEAEALRLRVALRDRRPVLLADAGMAPCEELDFSTAPAPEAAAQAWFAKACETPQDPEGGSPCRFALLRLGPERHLWARFITQVAADAHGRAALARRVRLHLRALEARLPPPPPPAPLAAALAGFALAPAARQAAARHWQDRLAAPPPLLWPLASASERATALVSLAPARVADLAAARDRARQAGTSLPRLALALAAQALGRHFGRSALVLALQLDLRGGARFRETIGSFSRALPLVAEGLEAPAEELARRLGASMAADYRHARGPLPPRPGGGPLADLVFNYLPAEEADEAWPELARHHGPSAPLMLTLRERGGALELLLDHNPLLLPADAAARLQAALLEALAPPRPAAPAALLAMGRGPRVALPEPATLPALVAAQARRTPAAVAVTDGAETLDYQGLMAGAEALAGRLAAAGVGPGAVVGLRLRRQAGLVATLLGIQRLGAAFLPLDPAWPIERQRLVLADAGAALLLAETAEAAGPTPLLRLDQPGPAAPLPPAGAGPQDTAYVLYTSGSTGRPKGVAVSQRSIANLALWGAGLLGTEAAGMVCSTALVFDVSLFEMFAPLVAGGQVLLVESLAALAASPLRGAARVLSGSPTVLDAALRLGGLPPGVTTIVAAGEALPRDMAERWRALRPGLRIVNAYGPTEATVYASAAEIGPGTAPPPIGRPLANMDLFVLDPAGVPLPPGQAGELHLGGVGVAQGYLNQPGLTAERFLPNPFGEGRLYRTGDRACWRADGQLEYLGRVDGQIKLHGVRIEPAEVEAALRGLPGVVAAAVGLHDGRLVAWLVAAGAAPSPEALRRGLAQRLPGSMIPSAFVLLPALPVTTSGKLDRAALPPPPAEPVPAPQRRRPPATPGEFAMLRLWQTVLDVTAIREGRIGAEETLAELGVDSLGVVLVCAEVEAVHGQPVPPALVEEGLSLASLAKHLDRQAAPRELHLMVDGQVVAAQREADGSHAFAISLPARDVRIVSPAAVPRQLNGAEDDRRLGVMLASMAWEQTGQLQQVALDQPLLGEGFHQWEPELQRRWTDGHAVLAADLVPDWQGTALLRLQSWDWQAGAEVAAASAAAEWLAGFESLGASCEFGFVQQALGVRAPLGLLRWAATDPARLLAGLEDGFAALEEPGRIKVEANEAGTEFWLHTPYARLHSFHSLAAAGPGGRAVMHRRGVAALGFLRRKLLADLAEGRHCFVFTTSLAGFGEAEMRALKAALARHGRGALLCVTLAAPGEAAAPTWRVAPGLYAARLGRLAGETGPYDEWLAICAAALVLRAEDGLGCVEPGVALPGRWRNHPGHNLGRGDEPG